MKSFNILVDRRLIQSDLIVVSLPIRNDIAAYYWLNLDSKLINNLVSEKAISPADKAGDIILNVSAGSSVTKYEVASVTPIVIGADADFKVLFPFDADDQRIEARQELQEVSQKIECLSLPVSIGANDMLATMPLKSAGRIKNAVELNVTAAETKKAIIDGSSGCNKMIIGFSGNPFVTYFEEPESILCPDANVKSLSYMLQLRLIQNNVDIGVNAVYFDLYRSLGKLSARIAVGSDASFAAQYFADAESILNMASSAETFPRKMIMPESSIVLECIGAAVLRRTRPLSEVDGFGTLSSIDDMELDSLYYADISE